VRDSRKDSRFAHCLPVSVHSKFFRSDQDRSDANATLIMYESPNSPHRTVFTDGRDLPKDANPTWLGYSVGRWKRYVGRDVRRVQRPGLARQRRTSTNRIASPDGTPPPSRLRPHGVRMTIDDPNVFVRPFTMKRRGCWLRTQTSSKTCVKRDRHQAQSNGPPGISLSRTFLRPLLACMSSRPDASRFTVVRDMLSRRGSTNPDFRPWRHRKRKFMSTANPTGFEFVRGRPGQRDARDCARAPTGSKGLRK